MIFAQIQSRPILRHCSRLTHPTTSSLQSSKSVPTSSRAKNRCVSQPWRSLGVRESGAEQLIALTFEVIAQDLLSLPDVAQGGVHAEGQFLAQVTLEQGAVDGGLFVLEGFWYAVQVDVRLREPELLSFFRSKAVRAVAAVVAEEHDARLHRVVRFALKKKEWARFY